MKIRKEGTESLIQSIKDSHAYGGTSVLIVVGKVDKDVNYQDCYTRSQAALKQAIPYAEDFGNSAVSLRMSGTTSLFPVQW
ncbi:MAG: hypothetical protein R3C11_23435 [Planctomycetaceae bacterium]